MISENLNGRNLSEQIFERTDYWSTTKIDCMVPSSATSSGGWHYNKKQTNKRVCNTKKRLEYHISCHLSLQKVFLLKVFTIYSSTYYALEQKQSLMYNRNLFYATTLQFIVVKDGLVSEDKLQIASKVYIYTLL